MKKSIKNAYLIYPPVGRYQRGEDRCQADTEGGTAQVLHAPNDLGYIASMLRRVGVEPKILDYPAEGKSWDDYRADVARIRPDMVVMSVTTATIRDDMQAFVIARELLPEVFTVAKGAHFFHCDPASLDLPEFKSLDVAIRGEAETIINGVVEAARGKAEMAAVRGVVSRGADGKFARAPDAPFLDDLDSIPYPARDLINNSLYKRPDNNRPLATIQVARGCPFDCIYCLTPSISGKKVRYRSTDNIVGELKECIERYGIRDFFFRADTFTINKPRVIDLCRRIIDEKMKIVWAANSRVDTIDAERLEWMKKAGCTMVAFGIESGNATILDKIKKGTTVEQARKAVGLCRDYRMKTYGFFMVGFPWESEKEINDTLDLALGLNCDFNEVHIATPYEGTALSGIARSLGLIEREVVCHDYFTNPPAGTLHLTKEQVMKLRIDGLRRLHLRPRYVLRTLLSIRSPRQFVNYVRYGLRFLRSVRKK